MGLFKKNTITLTCPDCGHETEQKVVWLLEHDDYVCPGCDKTVAIDKDKYAAELAKAKKRVDNSDVDDVINSLGF
jgi:uncharacterized Zn finger protein (UPF0148 family)